MMETSEEPGVGLRHPAHPRARRSSGQLRACCAPGRKEPWIMAPLVSRIEEVRRLGDPRRGGGGLDREGWARAATYRLGIAIEVPAALIADMLARGRLLRSAPTT
jgi:phosphoenolpyruvate-protein kinase (PTS system EI component)